MPSTPRQETFQRNPAVGHSLVEKTGHGWTRSDSQLLVADLAVFHARFVRVSTALACSRRYLVASEPGTALITEPCVRRVFVTAGGTESRRSQAAATLLAEICRLRVNCAAFLALHEVSPSASSFGDDMRLRTAFGLKISAQTRDFPHRRSVCFGRSRGLGRDVV